MSEYTVESLKRIIGEFLEAEESVDYCKERRDERDCADCSDFDDCRKIEHLLDCRQQLRFVILPEYKIAIEKAEREKESEVRK